MTAIIGKEMLWRQFGTAIDSLRDALRDCPEELWERQPWEDEPGQWVAAGFSAFWYLGYHTLFWLDLYLTGAEEGFAPPAPFDLVEMEPGEVLPALGSHACQRPVGQGHSGVGLESRLVHNQEIPI